MYIIICIASEVGCNDFGPKLSWYYKDIQQCEILANKMADAYVKEFEKRTKVIVDKKAFCLRFKESRET